MKIGFIGLGRMGEGMAGVLLKAGHEVVVYNRTASKAQALVSQGARHAATVADACHGEVVITMLADDSALEGVVLGKGGVLETLSPGAIHLSMSTISLALSERLTAEHAQAKQRFASAPVFGRPHVAAAGQLFIVASGPKDVLDACQPLLEKMGQKVFPLGEKPRDANLVKLSGNFLIASVIESLGESIALISKAGIDRHAFVEFLTSTLFAAPIYKTYAPIIAEEKYQPPGFAAPLGFKDVKLVLAAAESLRVPLPLGALLRERLVALLAQGGESLDWAAMARLAAQDSGQTSKAS
jgi:3-hydroxyisobutyrate dehydrogenase-like beta-hydroxyacid dehydrogenase